MSSLQQGFGALLNPSEEFQKLKAHLEHCAGAVNVSGVTEAAAAHLAFCAGQQLSRGVLLVAADGITARRLYDDLRFYDEDALLFLEKELLFYDADAAGHDVTVQRLAVLEALCQNPRQTVVTSVAALLRATAPKKGYESCMEFQTGGVCGGDVNSRFLELGYTREETVEGKGQYCIRGGIIDFFPCSSSLPYRVELFGDEVDSVRLFDPVSQRTVEKTESVTVPPASEMLLEGAARAAFEEQLRRLAEKAVDATQLRKDLERFQNSGVFPSMDRYLPLLYPELPTLLDYLPPDMLCMLYEPANISRSAERSALHIEETVAVFMEKGQIPNISGAWCYDYRRALQRLQQRPFVGLFGILTSCGDYHPAQQLTLTSKEQAAFHGKLDFFYDAVRTYHKSGYAVIVLAGTPQKAQNLTEALRRATCPAAYAEQLLKPPAAGEILVTCGALNGGVEYPLISTAIISDREIFGSARRAAAGAVSAAITSASKALRICTSATTLSTKAMGSACLTASKR